MVMENLFVLMTFCHTKKNAYINQKRASEKEATELLCFCGTAGGECRYTYRRFGVSNKNLALFTPSVLPFPHTHQGTLTRNGIEEFLSPSTAFLLSKNK